MQIEISSIWNPSKIVIKLIWSVRFRISRTSECNVRLVLIYRLASDIYSVLSSSLWRLWGVCVRLIECRSAFSIYVCVCTHFICFCVCLYVPSFQLVFNSSSRFWNELFRIVEKCKTVLPATCLMRIFRRKHWNVLNGIFRGIFLGFCVYFLILWFQCRKFWCIFYVWFTVLMFI